MGENTNNNNNPNGTSFLAELLSSTPTVDQPKQEDERPSGPIFEQPVKSVEPVQAPPSSQQPQGSSGSPQSPKKKGSQDFGRIFGAIFMAAIVFFSVFLAYVVFNPSQAQFFISLGINPQDIKNLLEKLVNYSFGILTGTISILTLILLFTAFATKKEYKKKKSIATIFSVFTIFLLFSVITLWAWLVQVIGATDYINPNGGIIIHDNEKMKSEKFKDGLDVMENFDNLIGPVTLQFDLSADARYISKYIDITSYSIDFTGDGKDIKTGVNPEKDQDVIFTYDKKGAFTPTGKYIGIDKVTGKEKEVQMEIPKITIVGITKVTERDDSRVGGKRVFIDVGDIKSLGRVDFYLEDSAGDFTDPDNSYDGTDRYSPQKTFKSESLICLVVKNNQRKPNDCDKIFIVGAEGQNDFSGEIEMEKDALNPLTFNFSFQSKSKNISISGYEWKFDDNTKSEDEFVEHTFLDFGTHEVTLTLQLANGKTVTNSKKVVITRPLTLAKPASDNPYDNNNSLLRLTDKSGKSVLDGTYKRDLSLYHIKIGLPQTLDFDASYVKVDENTYDLSKVEWDFDEDGKYEKEGEKLSYSFLEDKKYTIVIKYTFVSKLRKDTQTLGEKIVVEADKKEIDVKLKYKQESDYAPAVVHFDGSASQVKEGQITKFTYDFGEGKNPVDGDAKQDYIYKFPGEYTVVFTVTKDNGQKESTKAKVILKEKSKDVIINSSVSSGFIGKMIDFDAIGSVGQIDSYSWDFGDGSRSSEPTPSHSYDQAGTYTIRLILNFSDGVIKSGTKTITIR